MLLGNNPHNLSYYLLSLAFGCFCLFLVNGYYMREIFSEFFVYPVFWLWVIACMLLVLSLGAVSIGSQKSFISIPASLIVLSLIVVLTIKQVSTMLDVMELYKIQSMISEICDEDSHWNDGTLRAASVIRMSSNAAYNCDAPRGAVATSKSLNYTMERWQYSKISHRVILLE